MERTPLDKGVRTALQAIVGALIGLVLVVWAVPGVPEATIEYARTNLIPLLLVIGIPSGVVAWLQNLLGR
jgi:hypothetical protein